MDLNHGPSGYEPDELPDCSTPRCALSKSSFSFLGWQGGILVISAILVGRQAIQALL